MKVVTRRTGLSPELLRIWERRYGVVSPGRTHTGRRLYSDAEIERLHLLYKATLGGRSIGLIAHLSASSLATLIRQDGDAQPKAAKASQPSPAAPPNADGFVRASLAAVTRFEPAALDAALRRAGIALSAPDFLKAVVVPVLNSVAAQCREGTMRSIHGRLTVLVVRRVLVRMIDPASAAATMPRLLVTTIRGQSNGMGAILAAAAAAAEGWNVTWLGDELTAEDIAEAAKLLRVRAVGLGLSLPDGDLAVRDEVRRLREQLPARVTLMTRSEAANEPRTLDEIGSIQLSDLEAWISQLRGTAKPSAPPRA